MSFDQLIIERLAPLAASELMLNDHSAFMPTMPAIPAEVITN